MKVENVQIVYCWYQCFC